MQLCAFVALTLLASASMSAAQDKSALSISLNTPTVSPGETLMVTLRSPGNVQFAAVAVIWEKAIAPAATLPATVPIQIPDDMLPGKYAIAAMGRTVSNEEVMVATEVVVERIELPTKLSVRMSMIRFMNLGDEDPLRILADLPGGEVVDVTRSSLVTYTSSNPRVASVDEHGVVMAVSAGSASITATYTHGDASRRVVIPVTVPPPPFDVSSTPMDFGEVAVGSTVSRTFTLTNTTREPLEISSAQIGYEEHFAASNTCTSSLLAIGASCTITVTFTPAEAGRLMTLVWLEGGDRMRIGLSVMGTGVPRK